MAEDKKVRNDFHLDGVIENRIANSLGFEDIPHDKLEMWLTMLWAEYRETKAELDYSDKVIQKMSNLLHGVANAAKGDPGELKTWSWHDLPEVVEKLKRELDEVMNKPKGTSPCARHCESTAYEITIRNLEAQLKSARERNNNV